jgi:putative tricarboxylic transport membrane protein
MLAKLRADTLTSALTLLFAVYVAREGLELDIGGASNPGSGYILFWTGLLMAALSAAVLVGSLLPSGDRTGITEVFRGVLWGKVLYVTGLLVVYTAILPILGFILATLLLLLVLFKTVEPQSWTAAIVGSVLTTLSAWLVFVYWLGTQLPSGLFEIG